jgi:hypothetical protein
LACSLKNKNIKEGLSGYKILITEGTLHGSMYLQKIWQNKRFGMG